MKKTLHLLAKTMLIALAGTAMLSAAHAEKPEWAGHGRPNADQERRPSDDRYDRDGHHDERGDRRGVVAQT